MLALEYDPELARQAWIEKGIEQGIERGIEKGIEQGIEQSRKEFIKKLLEVETLLEYIIAATGWTKEQILSLAEGENL